MEVYIDDIVIKSESPSKHADELREIFGQKRKYNMRLNQEKLNFGIKSIKFLGFMLAHQGIEANLDKCETIIEMTRLANVKEVQRLVGRLASLSRFVPRLAEKARPLFKLLKKPQQFEWSVECEVAFEQFKSFLASPSILCKPESGRDLLLYLSVTDTTVTTVIVQEEGKQQRPIYFVSRVLHDAETRYQVIEKLVFTPVTVARRLRSYFQSHQVIVKTDHPIKQVLRKPELVGMMIAWSIELSMYGLKYEPRGALKAQCLSDFVTELSPLLEKDDEW